MVIQMREQQQISWHAGRDLNPRPSGSKPDPEARDSSGNEEPRMLCEMPPPVGDLAIARVRAGGENLAIDVAELIRRDLSS